MTLRNRMLSDGVVDLKLSRIERAGLFKPLSYIYDIYINNTNTQIGRCDYRVENNEENYYAGNIGYMIYQDYRGHHYAYCAATLLCDLAKRLKAESLIITCSPENKASHRTIERLGAKLIEKTTVPIDHFLHKQGERVKLIFEIDLRERN